MNEQDKKQDTEETASENVPSSAEEAAGNICRICRCNGFTSDPGDATICIAPSVSTRQRCGHSYLNH